VIPVFNEEAFLEETLESLRRQRFSDYTAWICDNSSTDRSAQIAGGFARRERMLVTSGRGRLARWMKLIAPGRVDRMAAAAIRDKR